MLRETRSQFPLTRASSSPCWREESRFGPARWIHAALLLAALTAALPRACQGQASGNVAFRQDYGKLRPDQNELAKRLRYSGEEPPGSNSVFLEASVLMNVKADEYVAVFALAQEGKTVAECNEKMDGVTKEFLAALRPLGVGANDWFVDFVAQHKIYDYRIEANVASEELAGFELKKNVSVHYRDKLLLDKLLLAAAGLKIYDLVKVDYLVKNPRQVQDRLQEEAAAIIKRKAERYQKLLGLRLLPRPQLYAEKPSIYFPSEMYEAYNAYASEQVDPDQFRSRLTVKRLRKSPTFYFNPLNGDGFDEVINPASLEPVVQFTLYLKVKYDLEPAPLK